MPSHLLEIIAALFAGALPTAPPPPEGTLNASLGAIAAFFGFVSVLLAVPAVAFCFSRSIRSEDLPLFLILFLVTSGCGALGILAGRRAPRVTARHLALAQCAYGACILAIAASLAALVVAASRALL
jgi:hypothetical protein